MTHKRLHKDCFIKWILSTCIIAIPLFASLLTGCNTKKNTAFNRFYQGFTTRYNVYYNGNNFYNDAYNSMMEGYKESFSEPIAIEPSSYTGDEEKKTSGGPYDNAITKARKAISLHSLRAKPEKMRIDRRNKKQRAFLEKVEYNPFLHNAWMLLGRSQFYNGDYLEAMATFSYIARVYKTEPAIKDEARLWQIRCYNAMGWVSDTDELLKQIGSNPKSKSAKRVYNLAMAEHEWKLGHANSAVPYLINAAKYEKNKRQKARLYYLAGQLAQESEMYQTAQKSFKKVISLAPPFDLDLAAKIRRTEIEGRNRPIPVARKLEKMAKKEKYENVLDQIYLSAGNTYMNVPDTAKAIHAYQTGSDSSHLHAADFALCNLKLGDIYYKQHRYSKAKPCFAKALGALNKMHPEYERVDQLSAQLDELVVFSKQVEEQDSLQHLASLPEKQRLSIIDSVIKIAKAEAKKKAREAARRGLKEQQDRMNQQADAMNPNQNNTPDIPTNSASNGEFYFYNPPMMTQGKNIFEKKWGRRLLEDNWRRHNKEPGFGGNDNTDLETPKGSDSTKLAGIDASDSTVTKQDSAILSKMNNPFEREYYLKNIPLTPEAMAKSDKLIEEGLFGMGKVFNEKMEKYDESIYAYEELLRRFPKYDKRLDVLYTLFLLYSRLDKSDDAERCRQMILKEFPDDNIAKALSDKEYINKLREKYNDQNKLYNRAYEAYFKGDESAVRNAFSEMKNNFPTSELMPKLAFLDALCYVLKGDNDGFKKALQEVISLKPDADLSELAQSMLAELLKGRRINQGGYRELDWNISFAKEGEVQEADLQPFSTDGGRFEMRLIFPSGSIDRNALIFAVSAFDYSRFTRYTLDAKLSELGNWDQIIIGDLPNASTAWFYIRQAYSKDGYMAKLIDRALLFPISKKNAELLSKGKPLGDYIDFLAKSYKGPDVETVVARWRALTGEEVLANEDESIQTPTEGKGKKVRSVRGRDQKNDSKQLEKKETEEKQESTGLKTEETSSLNENRAEKTEEKDNTTAAKPEPLQKEEISKEDKDKEQKTNEEEDLRDSTSGKEAEPSAKKDSTETAEDQPEKDSAEKTKNHQRPVVTPNENVTYSDVKEMYQDRKEEDKLSKREQEKIKRQKEKDRKKELRRRERERKQQLKQREKERKEQLKQREKERKEREKQRKEQLKKKEKERKEKLRQREEERKQREKKRREQEKERRTNTRN